MEERDKSILEKLERDYPGITSSIMHFDEADLPAYAHCGSDETASVQIGIISQTISIAGMTKKFHLIANGPRPGTYYCRKCKKYFD